jgi:hypothetical protein
MVAARGGVAKISSENGLRNILLQFGQLSYACLDVFPLGRSVEPETQCPIPPSPLLPRETLNALPLGFQWMIKKGALKENTIMIIVRMATQETGGQAQSPPPASEWHSLGPACPVFLSGDAGLLEKLLCLALLRYKVNGVMKLRHSVCPYENVAVRLTQKLPHITAPNSKPERETLLWCWLVTIDAWSIGVKDGWLAPVGVELLVQVPQKFPETRAWEISDFNAFGQKFFWRSSTQRWLRPAWESVKSNGMFESQTLNTALGYTASSQAISVHMKPQRVRFFDVPTSMVRRVGGKADSLAWKGDCVDEAVLDTAYYQEGIG